jgi:DNA topoisomerase-1
MLASGRDSKGRIQYLYSDEHKRQAHQRKFERVRVFADRFPSVERKLLRGLDQGYDEALVLLVIARTGMRIGNERDRRAARRTFGAATLLARHVNLDGTLIQFDFVGKQGIRNSQQLRSARLAGELSGRLTERRPGERLFDVSDDMVRDYLHEIAGDVLVKDLRTRHANLLARREVAALAPPRSEWELRRLRRRVAVAVSEQLGNTPAVCLSSYIDPQLFASWARTLSSTGSLARAV